jgi:DNA-binding transcriptional regulator YdaS (Cro superfamily)
MAEVHPLKAFRDAQDPPISQGELADMLGVKRETVTRWEVGSRKVGPDQLPKIAKKTGICPRELRPDLAEKLGAQ